MSLFRDRVTVWQLKVLGDIENMRAEGRGLGVKGPGTPGDEYNDTVRDNVLDNRSGRYDSGDPGGSDYTQSVKPFVEDNRSQDLPSTSFRPHGSSWMTHLGDQFGLSVDLGFGEISVGNFQQMEDNARRQLTGLAVDHVLGFIFGGDQIEKVSDRVNQYLEDKGFLEFQFDPLDEDSGFSNMGDPIPHAGPMRLPFFENPSIRESRRPTYASHQVVNRNEPWRLYTGAEARKVQLSFRLTLPHILEFALAYSKDEALSFMVSERGKDYWRGFQEKVSNMISDEPTQEEVDGVPSLRPASPGYQSLSNRNKEGKYRNETGHLWVPGRTASKAFVDGTGKPSREQEEMFLAYVQHMIDKIRSSVVGSVKTASVKAPPIVWLTFGTLYDRYPFIVRNYTMNFNDTGAGYDVNTLLPRVINISLSLEGFQSQAGWTPGRKRATQRTGYGGDWTWGDFGWSEKEGWDTILRTPGWDI